MCPLSALVHANHSPAFYLLSHTPPAVVFLPKPTRKGRNYSHINILLAIT
jgi:hypothetical protein